MVLHLGLEVPVRRKRRPELGTVEPELLATNLARDMVDMHQRIGIGIHLNWLQWPSPLDVFGTEGLHSEFWYFVQDGLPYFPLRLCW